MSDEIQRSIDHFSTLLEDQNSKLDAMLVGMNGLSTRDDFHRLEQRFDALESDVQTIKTAVTATNHDVAALEHRVTRLEAA